MIQLQTFVSFARPINSIIYVFFAVCARARQLAWLLPSNYKHLLDKAESIIEK